MNNNSPDQQNTHFGYQSVPKKQKKEKVGEVFHSVANRYDLMNDLMSFGIHRLWKRFAVHLSNVREGQNVLDLAGGTGDLAKLLAKQVGATGRVIIADINDSMLRQGRDRLLDQGITTNVTYTQCDAEALPFPDDYFDCITIAFGLRNVTDKDKALAAMHRVLKPGGQCLILEFSKPTLPGLSTIYDAYSFKALPRIGKWVTQDADSYRYLAESIRMHPNQETLKSMMETAGFEQCTYHNLTGGIVALHRGHKVRD